MLALLRLSLAHPRTTMLAALVVCLLGVLTARTLPVDVLPNLDRPVVTVLVEAGALSTSDVEAQVAAPVEAVLAGMPGLARLRTRVTPGIAIVTAEFDWGVEGRMARLQVTERLPLAAPRLPAGVTPTLAPPSSVMGEVMLVGVWSPEGDASVDSLRAAAEGRLRARLAAVPGVAQVSVIGGGRPALEVRGDPSAMAARGVGWQDLADAVSRATDVLAAGRVRLGETEGVVRVAGSPLDPDGLARATVREELRVGDVAQVVRGAAPAWGAAGVNGVPGVVLSVLKAPGADTRAVTRALEAVLSAADTELPAGAQVRVLFRQADFVDASVVNVFVALRDGAVLVALVLLVVLRRGRLVAISLAALPVSLGAAVAVLWLAGFGVDTMTLGGFAVAVGELVDDAIVDVENAWRRLREARRIDPDVAVRDVLFRASAEVRGSIVYSTLVVVLAMVPLAALGGMEGRLLAPLALAYGVAILASMVVSLTLTPVLCAAWLPSDAEEHADGRVVTWLHRLSTRSATLAVRRPRTVLLATGLVAGVALVSAAWLPRTFLPAFREGTATVNLWTAPGTTLAVTDALAARAERRLLAVDGVTHTGRRTGRAEGDEHAEGTHAAEIEVAFAPGRLPRIDVLREALSPFGPLVVAVGQPIGHRLDHLLSGVRAAVVVKLFGEDRGVLRVEAERLAQTLRGVPGLVDVRAEASAGVPELRVRPRPEVFAALRTSPGELARELDVAVAGRTVREVPDGALRVPIVVRATPGPDGLLDGRGLAGLPWATADGRMLDVGQVARVVEEPGAVEVSREEGRPRVAVTAGLAGDVAGADVVEALRAALRTRPPRAAWRLEGRLAAQEDAAMRMALWSVAALAVIWVVLARHLRSHRLVAQVLVNLPLAGAGGVVALWLAGTPISVAAMAGFVTLAGIASRNTLLLLGHARDLAREAGGVPTADALAAVVVQAARERIVPVAMTALAAGIALVPLAWTPNAPGREILAPVAQVVLGGLCVATLLDLFVTPALLVRDGGAALRRACAEE